MVLSASSNEAVDLTGVHRHQDPLLSARGPVTCGFSGKEQAIISSARSHSRSSSSISSACCYSAGVAWDSAAGWASVPAL